MGGEERGVAAGLADRLELQIAYAIGVARPVGLYVETFGTGKVSDEVITQAITSVFDLRPQAIIEQLDLLRPIYAQTAAYGHFGRELLISRGSAPTASKNCAALPGSDGTAVLMSPESRRIARVLLDSRCLNSIGSSTTRSLRNWATSRSGFGSACRCAPLGA